MLIARYVGPGAPSPVEEDVVRDILECRDDPGRSVVPPGDWVFEVLPPDPAGLAAAHAIGNFLGWCYDRSWPCPHGCGVGNLIYYLDPVLVKHTCDPEAVKHIAELDIPLIPMSQWNRRPSMVTG